MILQLYPGMWLLLLIGFTQESEIANILDNINLRNPFVLEEYLMALHMPFQYSVSCQEIQATVVESQYIVIVIAIPDDSCGRCKVFDSDSCFPQQQDLWIQFHCRHRQNSCQCGLIDMKFALQIPTQLQMLLHDVIFPNQVKLFVTPLSMWHFEESHSSDIKASCRSVQTSFIPTFDGFFEPNVIVAIPSQNNNFKAYPCRKTPMKCLHHSLLNIQPWIVSNAAHHFEEILYNVDPNKPIIHAVAYVSFHDFAENVRSINHAWSTRIIRSRFETMVYPIKNTWTLPFENQNDSNEGDDEKSVESSGNAISATRDMFNALQEVVDEQMKRKYPTKESRRLAQLIFNETKKLHQALAQICGQSDSQIPLSVNGSSNFNLKLTDELNLTISSLTAIHSVCNRTKIYIADLDDFRTIVKKANVPDSASWAVLMYDASNETTLAWYGVNTGTSMHSQRDGHLLCPKPYDPQKTEATLFSAINLLGKIRCLLSN